MFCPFDTFSANLVLGMVWARLCLVYRLRVLTRQPTMAPQLVFCPYNTANGISLMHVPLSLRVTGREPCTAHPAGALKGWEKRPNAHCVIQYIGALSQHALCAFMNRVNSATKLYRPRRVTVGTQKRSP